MKKIITVISAIILFVLAYLSWEYLAIILFRFALGNFYSIAPEVTEQCTAVVKDTVIAFTDIYDLVANIAAGVFLVLASLVLIAAYRSD
jgi:hypothetical protein